MNDTRVRESGSGSGRSEVAGSKGHAQKCGWDLGLRLISDDMNNQLDHINDLMEKDSELRDVCDQFP